MNLATPSSVQKLQMALHGKAKELPNWRFHALYDKVYRRDVLAFAYLDGIEPANPAHAVCALD